MLFNEFNEKRQLIPIDISPSNPVNYCEAEIGNLVSADLKTLWFYVLQCLDMRSCRVPRARARGHIYSPRVIDGPFLSGLVHTS